MAAAIGFEFAVVAITEKRVVVEVGFEVDTAAMAAVAARGAAARNVFFATESHTAIAAVAGLHKYFGFINKHGNSRKKDNTSELPVGRFSELHEKERLGFAGQ